MDSVGPASSGAIFKPIPVQKLRTDTLKQPKILITSSPWHLKVVVLA